MKRDDWKFAYTAAKLADAARAKLDHHTTRLEFWKARKDDVMTRIRAEGIEVEERVALSYRHPKERDYERGAHVVVRNDLQFELNECLEKLAFHTGQIDAFDGWQQVLAANAENRLELDIEDWLFFFGRH